MSLTSPFTAPDRAFNIVAAAAAPLATAVVLYHHAQPRVVYSRGACFVVWVSQRSLRVSHSIVFSSALNPAHVFLTHHTPLLTVTPHTTHLTSVEPTVRAPPPPPPPPQHPRARLTARAPPGSSSLACAQAALARHAGGQPQAIN